MDTTDLHKRKLTASQIYLLSLRQILLNQACLLAEAVRAGDYRRDDPFRLAGDTKDLAKRIEEFINKGE